MVDCRAALSASTPRSRAMDKYEQLAVVSSVKNLLIKQRQMDGYVVELYFFFVLFSILSTHRFF